MPSLQEIVSKESFKGLPPPEQSKVLEKLFPSYSSLPDEEKEKVLSKLGGVSIAKKEPSKPQTKQIYLNQAQPKKKSIFENFAQTQPNISGAGGIVSDLLASPGFEKYAPSMMGAMGGAAALSPIAPPFGGILGAFLGGAGGEGYRQATKSLTGAPDAPQTSREALKGVSQAGGREAAGEAIGGVGMKTFEKMFAPFAAGVTPQAKRISKYFDGRIKLTPAEATDKTIGSRILDFAENVGERSIIGGGYVSKFKGERDAIFDQIADEIVEDFGTRETAEGAGEAFLDVIGRKMGALKAEANVLYKHLDEVTKPEIVEVPVSKEVPTSILKPDGTPATKTVTEMVEKEVGGARISTKSLKAFVEPKLKTIKQTAGIGGESAGDKLAKDIMNLPDEMTFQRAKELRTRLNSIVEEFYGPTGNKKAPAIGLTKKLSGLVNSEIKKGLGAFDQEALKEWNAINNFYRTNKKDFDNKLIRKMVRKADPELGGQPEKFAQSVFNKNNIGMIKAVKKSTDPETWTKLQSFYIQDIIQKARNSKTNTISGEKLNKYLNTAGEDTLREVFSKEQISNIKKFAEALKVAQSEQGGGTGKVLIELTQGSAIPALAFGGAHGQAYALTVLLGPPTLARAMLNPKVAKYLTEGIVQLPKGSAAAGGFTTRLARDLERMEAENRKYLGIEKEKNPNPKLNAL